MVLAKNESAVNWKIELSSYNLQLMEGFCINQLELISYQIGVITDSFPQAITPELVCLLLADHSLK